MADGEEVLISDDDDDVQGGSSSSYQPHNVDDDEDVVVGGSSSAQGGKEGDELQQQISDLRAALNAKKRERKAAEETYMALCEEEQTIESNLKALVKEANETLQSVDWSTTFAWTTEVRATLKSTFKLETFRALQEEVINATLDTKDVVVVMPTGGGKSLLYMLPALIQPGFTLVVSPLLALMHDQLEQLSAMGIPAAVVSAHTPKEEVSATYNALTDAKSKLKLLYVTPERIVKSKTLISRLEKAYKAGRLQRVAIDEAHCISQWGHDWRPDYAKLALFKHQFPRTPLLALTATATAQVQRDIEKSLGLSAPVRFRRSVDRPNLQYEVATKAMSAEGAMADIAREVSGRFRGQAGIVYCFSKKEAEQVAQYLQQHGVRAKFYHADLEMYASGHGRSGRMEVYQEWTDGRLQVVVATTAFGMGINKADARFVIHHSLSKSISAYYQEAGRAGRDGAPATCLLYYRPADLIRQSTLAVGNQLHGAVQGVYQLVSYCERMLAAPPGPETHLLGRELIAAHYNERLVLRGGKGSQGGGGGAHGGGGGGEEEGEEDVSEEAQGVVRLAIALQKADRPTTLLQLAEIWKGSGRKAEWQLPAVTSDPHVTKGELERRLALLLVEGVLQQRFAFTAYAVNSYLQPGPKAQDVLSGKHRVRIRRPPSQEGKAKGGAKGAGKKRARKSKGKSKEEEGGEKEVVASLLLCCAHSTGCAVLTLCDVT